MMTSTIKQLIRDAIIVTPPGRRFFSRLEALRAQNERISAELADMRARLAAAVDSSYQVDGPAPQSGSRLVELERPLEGVEQEAPVLRGGALRDKQQTLQLLATKGFAPDLVVDVGAAWATDGLYETWPAAHYILVEPLEKYREPLLRVCASLDSAEVLIAGVGAAPGSLKMAAHPTEPHSLTFQEDAPVGWLHFSVPMLTLDGILAGARKHRRVERALIKIDVDGPEISVLEGANASLAGGRDVYLIEAALLDTERGRLGELVNYMATSGYEVFDIIEPVFRPSDQVLWQVDLVFVPRSASVRGQRHFFSKT